MNDLCSCVILNYNDAQTTINLIREIYGYKNINKIVVVDNCSTDDSVFQLKKIVDEKIILLTEKKNGGYGAGNNAGVRYVYNELKEQLVLIANPDVKFTNDLVCELISAIESSENCILASAIQKDINGNYIEDFAWKIPSIFEMTFMDFKPFKKEIFHRMHYSRNCINNTGKMEVECVPGALLMVDAERFLEIDGYDENMFLFCEEILLALKIRKTKYQSLLICNKSYDHIHSVTINKSIKSLIKQYKLIIEGRLYLMKHYMRANWIQLLIAKIVYAILVVRRKIKGDK